MPEAIAHYEAAVRLEPSNASMRNNLAVAYAQSGRIEEAIRQLKTALEHDPTHRGARGNLEKLLAP